MRASQRESVDQIIGAGGHLLHLVNEVLDISRIESGNYSFEFEPLAVSDLLVEACDLIGPVAGKARIPIILRPGAPECCRHVLADRQRGPSGAAQFALQRREVQSRARAA